MFVYYNHIFYVSANQYYFKWEVMKLIAIILMTGCIYSSLWSVFYSDVYSSLLAKQSPNLQSFQAWCKARMFLMVLPMILRLLYLFNWVQLTMRKCKLHALMYVENFGYWKFQYHLLGVFSQTGTELKQSAVPNPYLKPDWLGSRKICLFQKPLELRNNHLLWYLA